MNGNVKKTAKVRIRRKGAKYLVIKYFYLYLQRDFIMGWNSLVSSLLSKRNGKNRSFFLFYIPHVHL